MRRKRKKNAEFYETMLVHLKSQSFLCAYCNCNLKALAYSKIHIDHIIPLSKGGKDDPSNFAVVCSDCNSLKSDLTIEEFLNKVEHKRDRYNVILEKRESLLRVEKYLLTEYGKEIHCN